MLEIRIYLVLTTIMFILLKKFQYIMDLLDKINWKLKFQEETYSLKGRKKNL